MSFFFPSFDQRFTQAPNIFFDQIIFNDCATFNEVKLVSYLIRNTIGYNNKAAWIGVSREKLIKKAKISNGAINSTIESAINKNWILDFKVGPRGKEKRYLFLNTETNQKIVYCLQESLFDINDLQDLNESGISKLINKHTAASQVTEVPKDLMLVDAVTNSVLPADIIDENICAPTEIGEGNIWTPTEIVGVPLQKLEGTPTKIVGGTPTEIVGVNELSCQTAQGVSQPLNTSFKYINNKYILYKHQQQQVENHFHIKYKADVVVYKEVIEELLEKKLPLKQVGHLVSLAIFNKKSLIKCIKNTQRVIHLKSLLNEEILNIYGLICYEISSGWDLITLEKQAKWKPKRSFISGKDSSSLEMIEEQERGDFSPRMSKEELAIKQQRVKDMIAEMQEKRQDYIKEAPGNTI